MKWQVTKKIIQRVFVIRKNSRPAWILISFTNKKISYGERQYPLLLELISTSCWGSRRISLQVNPDKRMAVL